MTPDMQRLCDALKPYENLPDQIECSPEDAIRAFFLALRTVSDDTARAGAQVMARITGHTVDPRHAGEVLNAMIDHILAEHATA